MSAYRDKKCKLCGAVFLPKSPNGKYCPECGPKVKAEKKKTWKERFKPPKPTDEEFHTCDRLEQVAKCLNCKRSMCNGYCPDVKSPDRSAREERRKKELEESVKQIAHYIRAGATDSFIVRELGLTNRQLAYRKNMARESGLLLGEK